MKVVIGKHGKTREGCTVVSALLGTAKVVIDDRRVIRKYAAYPNYLGEGYPHKYDIVELS